MADHFQRHETANLCYVLDLGAGRGILEEAIDNDKRFAPYRSRLIFITLDVADINNQQLLSSNQQHVIAEGEKPPFVDKAFDLVISNMAIDLMPRDDVFQQVNRIIKLDGRIILNLHHPNLIEIATQKLKLLRQELKKLQRKLDYKSPGNSDYNQISEKIKEIQQQMKDAEFIIQNGPKMFFPNREEILAYLSPFFPQREIKIKEVPYGEIGENGWWEVDIGPVILSA